MNIKRILLAGIFQVVVLFLSFGQTIDLNSKLSKRQMYKDFDEFVQIIDSSTQTLVRKIATGYDAAEQIRQRRSEIDTIKSYGEFLRFLEGCLTFTMCGHARMAPQCYENSSIADKQIVSPLHKAYEKYVDSLRRSRNPIMSLGNGFYYKGDYYIKGRQIFFNENTLDTIILTNYRLIKHNDESIVSLKNSYMVRSNPHWQRWDHQLQQYYNVYVPFIPRSDKITVEDYATKKIIEFVGSNYARRFEPYSLSEKIRMTLPQNEESDNMKITYYDSLRVLYIYMGEMVYDSNFVDSIKKIGAGKKIDKIIWDVRDNLGGTDWAWISVLQAIIKNPLPVKIWISFRNTKVMRSAFEDYLKEFPRDTLKHVISFLENTEFLTIVFSDENDKEQSFVPDTNSLQYEGKIYILQNEWVASSTGSLLSDAQQISQLITVGVPTGNLMGRGFSPKVFQLSESKFTFFMESCVDLTNCKTAIEVFHDRPEIEIYPKLEEIIDMNNYGCFLNKRGDEFLFKHDYLFKKVLEMK